MMTSNKLEYKGLVAWVDVDNKPAPCFHPFENKKEKNLGCVIASQESKRFAVNFTASDPKCSLHLRLYLDGKPVSQRFYDRNTMKPAKIRISDCWTSDTTVRPFVFMPLQTTDDEAYVEKAHLSQGASQTQKSDSRVNAKLGEIKLVVNRIVKLQITNEKVAYLPTGAAGGGCLKETIPKMSAVHEKSVKAASMSHQISYGDKVEIKQKRNADGTTNQKVINGNTKELITSFTFKYMPLSAIHALDKEKNAPSESHPQAPLPNAGLVQVKPEPQTLPLPHIVKSSSQTPPLSLSLPLPGRSGSVEAKSQPPPPLPLPRAIPKPLAHLPNPKPKDPSPIVASNSTPSPTSNIWGTPIPMPMPTPTPTRPAPAPGWDQSLRQCSIPLLNLPDPEPEEQKPVVEDVDMDVVANDVTSAVVGSQEGDSKNHDDDDDDGDVLLKTLQQIQVLLQKCHETKKRKRQEATATTTTSGSVAATTRTRTPPPIRNLSSSSPGDRPGSSSASNMLPTPDPSPRPSKKVKHETPHTAVFSSPSVEEREVIDLTWC